jgi:hypothetical protein
MASVTNIIMLSLVKHSVPTIDTFGVAFLCTRDVTLPGMRSCQTRELKRWACSDVFISILVFGFITFFFTTNELT